jgi:SAM-dependent methyltransferase
MELERLRRTWENLGRRDPMWAVLSDPAKAGGRWDRGEFFATGENDVAWLRAWLQQLGVDLPAGDALDFGCGVGRLSQALAPCFASVTGVDISEPMVERARAENRHGERVRYVCNPRADLALFGDGVFAFAMTVLVLQHLRPAYTLGYLRELLRVLRPGGLLFFQLPTAELYADAAPPAPHVEIPGEAHMEMHVVPRADVLAAIAAGGGDVLRDEEDRWAGAHWQSFHFLVRKR